MEYRIVELPAFDIIGKPLRVSMKDGGNLSAIPQFWATSGKDGSIDRLKAYSKKDGVTNGHILGACTDFDHSSQEFTYLIAFEADAGNATGNELAKSLPSATWAVFESKGALPQAIQSVWQQIFSEFFPTSGYKHAAVDTELEIYPPGGDVSKDDYVCEVWIPVVKAE